MARRDFFPALAVSAALVFAAMYLVAAIPRIVYPYDLDFVEDSMLLQALRWARGLPVFAPPSADFVPHVYMPLYTWLGGWLFRLTGPGFVPLRLLSFTATFTTAGFLFYIARRESGQRWIGLTCAGLYLGGYRISGFWYELARVDSLYVALVIIGLALGIYANGSRRRLVASAAVLALAFFTKQTGLAFGVALIAYRLWPMAYRRDTPHAISRNIAPGRNTLWFALLLSTFILIPLFAFNALTSGWFFYYVFAAASADAVDIVRVFRYVGLELFGVMAGVSVMAVIAGVLAIRHEGLTALRRQPWFLMIGTAVVVSGTGRASVGGNLNNLMPAYALLGLAPALLARRAPGWGMRLASLAILLQFALGVYNPLRYVPTPAMRTSGDVLIAHIRAIDGPVLVMLHPYYAWLAGKAPSAQVAQLWHFQHWLGAPLPADFVQRIRDQYYAAIVSDQSLFETDPIILDVLSAHYVPAGELEAPPTLTGMVVQPMMIYVPK